MKPGDIAPAEALYARYRRAMLGAAVKVAGDPHDAEDIVSMSWLKLLRHMPALLEMEERARAAYIMRCVRTEAIDLLRARSRDRDRNARLRAAQSMPGEPLSLAEALRRLAVDLPPREREAVALRLAGLGDAEIARRMGVRQGTVRVYLHRAHRRMSAKALLDE